MYQKYSNSHKRKVHIVCDQVKLNEIQKKEKRNSNSETDHCFKQNDIVYTLSAERNRNKARKRYSGPFVITKLLENNRIELKHPKTNKLSIFHVKELRPKTKTSTHFQMSPDNDDTDTDGHIKTIKTTTNVGVLPVASTLLDVYTSIRNAEQS